MSDFLKVCEQAARAGGETLLQWKGKVRSREKNPRDLVTEADVASQQVIRDIVLDAFPDHDFLGEETLPEGPSPKDGGSESRAEFRWIVDPLDGTTNYVHQLRSYAVSVALQRDQKIIAGVVFDPECDECYRAELGKGAEMNGQPLRPSDCRTLEQALVAVSLPAHLPRDSVEISRMIEVIHACQGMRRLGSAALNLCYVAQGCLDAYWATSVNVWDIAAGMLIVQEAGGVITSLDGGPVDLERPWFAAASTPPLQRELLDVLHRASA